MGKDRLEELAVHCEQVTGPDRELDAAIHCALTGYEFPQPPYSQELPYDRFRPELGVFEQATREGLLLQAYKDSAERYTASLDAAMTLVPEGWLLSELSDRRVNEGERTPFQPPSGEYSARLYYFRQDERDPPRLRNLIFGKGKSRALALCAAALRAAQERPNG